MNYKDPMILILLMLLILLLSHFYRLQIMFIHHMMILLFSRPGTDTGADFVDRYGAESSSAPAEQSASGSQRSARQDRTSAFAPHVARADWRLFASGPEDAGLSAIDAGLSADPTASPGSSMIVSAIPI
jgi:hypothetical protein